MSSRCVIEPTATSTPTPGPPTPTRTRTRTRTPTQRIEFQIQDASVLEADRDVSVSFIITLSSALSQPTVFGLTVSAGSATQNVDYMLETGNGVAVTNASESVTFGTVTIPANTTASGNLGFRIIGDDFLELNETFFVSLTNPSLVGVDTSATGTIINDDRFPIVRTLGVAELAPQQWVTRAGLATLLVLSWTHPQRWRDLATIDLRLRDNDNTAIWVRFDEAANTFALVDSSGTPGPALAPRTPGELLAEHAALLVADSHWQEAEPEATEVAVTLALRFAPSEGEGIYEVEAAAADDTGKQQEFETVGTLLVLPPPPCPGDCNNDGTVRIHELLRGVSILLSQSSLGECPAFDAAPNGAIEVNELVAGVAAALRGCDAQPPS